MESETKSFIYFLLACKWRNKFINQKKLHFYQLRKAQSIVNFAYNNSKYFKNHFNGFEIKDVWNLPVTNKKLLKLIAALR